MPNLFKIDFIQGKTDASDYNQVKHSRKIQLPIEPSSAYLSLPISCSRSPTTAENPSG